MSLSNGPYLPLILMKDLATQHMLKICDLLIRNIEQG